MAKVNLDKMSLDDLKALQKDVTKAIASFEKRKVDEARKAIEALAKKHGVSLDDVLPGKRKARGKAAKAKAPAKFRNPNNAEETWSGRGRQPDWFKKAEKAGKSRESMAI